MRFCYWCNKCPYNMQCSQVNFPASAYPDGYMKPMPEYYDRDKYNLDSNDAMGKLPYNEERIKHQIKNASSVENEEMLKKLDKRQQVITRVVELINQRALQEYDEIVRIGMDRKLLDYIIRTFVQYIDKNYDRYQGDVSRKVEMTIFDIKRDLTWVFDILRIYNVSAATENRMIDKIAKIALQSLRLE